MNISKTSIYDKECVYNPQKVAELKKYITSEKAKEKFADYEEAKYERDHAQEKYHIPGVLSVWIKKGMPTDEFEKAKEMYGLVVTVGPIDYSPRTYVVDVLVRLDQTVEKMGKILEELDVVGKTAPESFYVIDDPEFSEEVSQPSEPSETSAPTESEPSASEPSKEASSEAPSEPSKASTPAVSTEPSMEAPSQPTSDSSLPPLTEAELAQIKADAEKLNALTDVDEMRSILDEYFKDKYYDKECVYNPQKVAELKKYITSEKAKEKFADYEEAKYERDHAQEKYHIPGVLSVWIKKGMPTDEFEKAKEMYGLVVTVGPIDYSPRTYLVDVLVRLDQTVEKMGKILEELDVVGKTGPETFNVIDDPEFSEEISQPSEPSETSAPTESEPSASEPSKEASSEAPSEPSKASAPAVSSEPSKDIPSAPSSEPSKASAPAVSSEPSKETSSAPTSKPSKASAPAVSSEPPKETPSAPTSEPSKASAPAVSSEPSKETSSAPTSEPSKETPNVPTSEPPKETPSALASEPSKASTPAVSSEPSKVMPSAPTNEPSKTSTPPVSNEPSKETPSAPTSEPSKASTPSVSSEPSKETSSAPTSEPSKASAPSVSSEPSKETPSEPSKISEPASAPSMSSEPSKEQPAKISAPEKVKSVTAYKISKTTAKITWKKVKNADGYRIFYRDEKTKKCSSKSLNAKTTAYTLQKLQADRTYQVWVVAYNTIGTEKICSEAYTTRTLNMKKQPTKSDLKVADKLTLSKGNHKKLNVVLTKGKDTSYIAGITYKVKDKKICTVKNGTLTAKKTGSTKVTTTVRLKNGQEKTFSTTVKVVKKK